MLDHRRLLQALALGAAGLALPTRSVFQIPYGPTKRLHGHTNLMQFTAGALPAALLEASHEPAALGVEMRIRRPGKGSIWAIHSPPVMGAGYRFPPEDRLVLHPFETIEIEGAERVVWEEIGGGVYTASIGNELAHPLGLLYDNPPASSRFSVKP